MKSTKTCPFFKSLDLYWMPYSLNSIAQQATLPDRSVYELYPEVEDQLVPQRDESGSMGGVFG